LLLLLFVFVFVEAADDFVRKDGIPRKY